MKDVIAAAAQFAAQGGVGALASDLADGRRALFGERGEILAGELAAEVIADLADQLPGLLASGRHTVVEAGGVAVFVEVFTPRPVLRIFGAGPIAEALAVMGQEASFDVVVGDPRPALLDQSRFPDGVVVEEGWPQDLLGTRPLDERSFVVSLLHEARFEDSLLPPALSSAAPYVGALGSRKTHRARIERLDGLGVAADAIERLHAPIGLSIGALTPAEIAVSILAEVVAERRRRD